MRTLTRTPDNEREYPNLLSKNFSFESYEPWMLGPVKGKTWELPTNPGFLLEDASDPRNLHFYDTKDFDNLVFKLEVLNREKTLRQSPELVFAVIGTGGTIAMIKANGELVAILDPQALLDELPGSLKGLYSAAAIQIPTLVDSSLMPPDVIGDTAILMTSAHKRMSPELQANFGGFLVLHGTDTLAQSAALLRMMLGRDVPFNTAFVGAQKTIEDRYNDVSTNMSGAVTCLTLAHEIKEYSHHFVFMNGTSGAAMNPAGLTKISDSNVIAFSTPMHDPFVNAANFGVEQFKIIAANALNVPKRRRSNFNPIIPRGYIDIKVVIAQYGKDPEIDRREILALKNDHLSGIQLVTYGSFTFHTANLLAITEAAKEIGVPVFVSNPFPNGSTDHQYGPALKIKNTGAATVDKMPAALAAKIHVAHAKYGDDTAAKTAWIIGDYVGEAPHSVIEKPLVRAGPGNR